MKGLFLMNPKISVIMPMYNVEKYVGCAIQSLLNQTFTDFEAILIDDCSTDNTLAVAKSFADSRIKIFKNKKNLGAAQSRNIGMSHAQGEYIYFFDSDDALMSNALEILFNNAQKHNSDLVVSTVYLHSNDSEFQSLENLNYTPIAAGVMGEVSSDLKMRIWDEYALHKTHCSVCFSLYKKSVFKAIGGGV